MSDYLDHPPKRYRCFGKDDFGHPYEALTAEEPDGEWVRFADMDLYMFEGGQLLHQAAARIEALEAALRTAFHALRSYQYGNAATELAKEVADAAEAALAGSAPRDMVIERIEEGR